MLYMIIALGVFLVAIGLGYATTHEGGELS
jgi:hypothetical protein